MSMLVVIYTAVGGLKATFLTDFLHTAIALILIIYFTISVLTNEHVGGLDGLYDKLQATAGDHYIKGNFEGSLITFKSKGAILFGIVLKFGNLALVVMVSSISTTLLRIRHLTNVDNRTPHSGRNHSHPKSAPQSQDTISPP